MNDISNSTLLYGFDECGYDRFTWDNQDLRCYKFNPNYPIYFLVEVSSVYISSRCDLDYAIAACHLNGNIKDGCSWFVYDLNNYAVVREVKQEEINGVMSRIEFEYTSSRTYYIRK